mmetsp:Transcript_19284/g.60626  ORF Transcript_19284/g.60626 Transcript_19284/m.60626 type:complete len:270 (+) Transcript_19284:649-1458(+)
MVHLPVELAVVVHVELAGRLVQALLELRELRLEQPADRVHTRGALRLVVLAVPEARANALVQVRDVLLVVHALRARGQLPPRHFVGALSEGHVPEGVVVGNAHELVQHDLARLLVAVGAVGRSRGLGAVPPRHLLEALGRLCPVDVQSHLVWVDLLVGHAHARARAGQGVPQGSAAFVGALLAVPGGLRLAEVLCHLDVAHLTADDEPVVIVDLRADGRGAARGVEGHEGPELALVRVPELPGVLHRDLVALDAVDVVFPGGVAHNLVV